MTTKRESSMMIPHILKERAKCYRKLGKLKEAAADQSQLAKYQTTSRTY
jgi:hypothetical protein